MAMGSSVILAGMMKLLVIMVIPSFPAFSTSKS